MTKSVCFITPTLLDIKAITTFGINAKPNSTSPIGFFGTGLKYAIAVLLRENCEIEINIGEDSCKFYTKAEEFRDKEFSFIYMTYFNDSTGKRKKLQLPFTTELGKNWTLWQAFRELYSNTIDENGSCVSYENDILEDLNLPSEDKTLISVTSEAFLEVFEDKDSVFLEDGLNTFTSDIIQIIDRPSERIYYRSMRALDLEYETRFTYNILTSLSLTEDRTIKYSWEADKIIAHYIAVNCTDESIIEAVLSQEENTYEGRLNFEDVYATSSGQFSRVYHKLGKDIKNKSVRGYYSSYGNGRYIPTDNRTWQERLIEALKNGQYSKGWDVLELYKDEVIALFEQQSKIEIKYKELYPLLEVNDAQLDLFNN